MKGLAFPLTAYAFASVGTSYVGALFTTTTRWGFLALLLAVVSARGHLIVAFRSPIAVPVYLYGLWGLVTAAWSPVADLSFMKAAAALLLTTAFIAGGEYWLKAQRGASPVLHLLPIVALALVAGLFGSSGADEAFRRGLTANSNQLGILTAIATTYIFYRVYLAFSRPGLMARVATVGLAAVVAGVLWLTASRSAILCAVVIAASGLAALRAGTRLRVAGLSGLVALAAVMAVPDIQENAYQHLLLKSAVTGSSAEDVDILESRRAPWAQSYAAAAEGGLMGLGFGVSAGDTDFSGGFTAQTYGREKGNSQLAIVEETGLVGLVLYAALVIAIVGTLMGGIRRAEDPDVRVGMALLLGCVLGQLVQSAFEAWWTAPGSADSALFWANVGVGVAFARRLAAEPADEKKPEGARRGPESGVISLRA